VTDNELWTSPDGFVCELVPVPWPDEFEWYADQPGQRPPRFYELTSVDDVFTEERVVYPVEPWSPYDAISDQLIRDGWTGPPPTEEQLATCEHGLAAWLCAGPEHYPMDLVDW
jgi:hypothetical protein